MTKNSGNGVEVHNADSKYESHYIVGIGASAGGLEAIHELFDNLPQNTGFSFVIIQHLSPDYKSLLAELLTRHTKMKVLEAEDGLTAGRNCVYVIPSKKTLTIRDGTLRLTEKPSSAAPNNAIDTFFLSLAEDKKDKAIGIILSGTGSDGTKGIAAIKKKRGLVMVQDPLTAKFDGMPNSAINSGNVDMVLAPEFMPEEIYNYLDEVPKDKTFIDNISEKDEETILGILSLVHQCTSHDFSSYKRPTIFRRITKQMAALRIEEIDEYYEFLKENEEEVNLLCKEFLIGVTKFFRDPSAFEVVKKEVLPDILNQKKSSDVVKVWVVACSTGEEAYSLAIIIREYLNTLDADPEVKIFATDIDKRAVEIASKGLYPTSSCNEISKERLDNFFIKESNGYRISPVIRKMVIFANHDVTKDAPYGKIDMISCRNMLIYMNFQLQRRVFRTFHFALNVGGYLFLGPSENPGEHRSHLIDISKKWRIFKNTSAARSTGVDPQTYGFVRDINTLPHENRNLPKEKPFNHSSFFNEVLVEKFKYAGIFVDENFEVKHAVGDYASFLKLPTKSLQLNLSKMIPEEISITLLTAVRKSIREKKEVELKGIKITKGGKTHTLSILVRPVAELHNHTFLLFNEEKIEDSVEDSYEVNKSAIIDHDLFEALEYELKETRENLQSAVEELETANEELQSSNEELMSSNEELQSTNEELQSLNEELHTVNSEHQIKIKELLDLNDDLTNYFSSTDIGQIFIDNDLLIRKFTPNVTNQINLIENDLGRPITHISNNLKYGGGGLLEDIKVVISLGQVVQREIEVTNGSFYLMRIFPYVKHDKKIDGVVVTFVNITELKKLNLLVTGVLNSSINGIMGLNAIRNRQGNVTDFECILANQAVYKIFGKTEEELAGKRLFGALPEQKENGLYSRYLEVIDTGNPLHFQIKYEETYLEVVAAKMGDGVAVTFSDITEKKMAEDRMSIAYQELKRAEEGLKNLNNQLELRVNERTKELSVSEERLRLISQATNDVVWDLNLTTNSIWWNEALRNVLGYWADHNEDGIESWSKKIHPEEKETVLNSLHHALNANKSQWSSEYRYQKADGSYAFIYHRGYILSDEHNTPYRVLSSMIDLTDLKRAQEELNKSNLVLKKINADLDNFVYTASHDLKAPIANIEGLVYVLDKELGDNNERVTHLLTLVKKSVDKFKSTITDLTEISKIQKNIEEDIAIIDINELIEDVKVSLRELIADNDAIIDVKCEDCFTIKFSRKNLQSILYNLISNGIKYRSPDRVPKINITMERSGEYVLLKVADNGLGIAEEKMSKMFSMFKRFHTHVEGTGIGLYIVKRIMDNMEGRIEVQSEENVGTTFLLYFKN